MTCVHIKGLVSFSANYGVQVEEAAIHASPEEVHAAIVLAYSHWQDEVLLDACCGATGPLAGYSDLEFDEYMRLLADFETQQAGAEAKRAITKARRSQFNAKRDALVLAMLDANVPYKCAMCEVREELTVDHIVPLSRGGTDDLANLQFLCRPHNSSKGDRSPTGKRWPRRARESPEDAQDTPAGVAPPPAEKSIVGMYLHTLEDDGTICHQGRIVGRDGETFLVQLFEWFMGEPTNIAPMERSFVFSDKCRLYSTGEAWRFAAEGNERRMAARLARESHQPVHGQRHPDDN